MQFPLRNPELSVSDNHGTGIGLFSILAVCGFLLKYNHVVLLYTCIKRVSMELHPLDLPPWLFFEMERHLRLEKSISFFLILDIIMHAPLAPSHPYFALQLNLSVLN
ncbi:hypothetical protein BGZ63DRAFT_151686 [Mariannaea sp. PMI_226]|nr:hypothetical protein BGZ63DRAFT_151686 [Mariannaea sp. PMI_226]